MKAMKAMKATKAMSATKAMKAMKAMKATKAMSAMKAMKAMKSMKGMKVIKACMTQEHLKAKMAAKFWAKIAKAARKRTLDASVIEALDLAAEHGSVPIACNFENL